MPQTVKNNVSLSQQVYRTLLEMLMNNELVPGQFLNRRQIAAELRVSVAPVLEAVLQLQLEGFLETIPRKGTQVRIFQPSEVRGLLIVREAIECQAARMCCGEPIRRNLKRLLHSARKLDELSTLEPEEWQRDIQFHRHLVSLSACDPIIEEHERVIKLSVFHMLHRLVSPTEEGTRESHVQLVERLASATPIEAEELMRRHVRTGKGHIADYP
ncbi:MAG: GntR family transcriptional regulator [Spirochaetes bacterium]|nr:GntR family transcriptional regulator [Chloroflexota bacterium]MCX7038167.1 GntR family transcriptional regulator [Spirochaetota bacterium]